MTLGVTNSWYISVPNKRPGKISEKLTCNAIAQNRNRRRHQTAAPPRSDLQGHLLTTPPLAFAEFAQPVRGTVQLGCREPKFRRTIASQARVVAGARSGLQRSRTVDRPGTYHRLDYPGALGRNSKTVSRRTIILIGVASQKPLRSHRHRINHRGAGTMYRAYRQGSGATRAPSASRMRVVLHR